MILKVRSNWDGHWIFYDHIQKIRVFDLEWKTIKQGDDKDPALYPPPTYEFRIDFPRSEAIQTICPNAVYVDFTKVKEPNTPEKDKGYCLCAECTIGTEERLYNDGVVYPTLLLAFDEGYLLNDEGHTIERL